MMRFFCNKECCFFYDVHYICCRTIFMNKDYNPLCIVNELACIILLLTIIINKKVMMDVCYSITSERLKARADRMRIRRRKRRDAPTAEL